MELNNLPDVDIWEPIDSSQLSYKDNTRNEELVSKVADSNITADLQHGTHESPALKTTPKPQGRGTPINNSNSVLQNTFNI